MGNSLKKWLDCDQMPDSFYQLVGKPSLCHRRDELDSAISKAYAFYLKYQSHRDPKKQERAIALMTLLGQARSDIADERRWREYNERNIIAPLRRKFERNMKNGTAPSRFADVRRWLTHVQNVDPQRASDIAQSLLAAFSTLLPDSQSSDSSGHREAELPEVEDIALAPAREETRSEVNGSRTDSVVLPDSPSTATSTPNEWIPLLDDHDASPGTERIESVRPKSRESATEDRPVRTTSKSAGSKSRKRRSPIVPRADSGTLDAQRRNRRGADATAPLTPAPPPKLPRSTSAECPVPPQPPHATKPDRARRQQAATSEHATLWMLVIGSAAAIIVALIGTVAAVMMGVFDRAEPVPKGPATTEVRQGNSAESKNPHRTSEDAPQPADAPSTDAPQTLPPSGVPQSRIPSESTHTTRLHAIRATCRIVPSASTRFVAETKLPILNYSPLRL